LAFAVDNLVDSVLVADNSADSVLGQVVLGVAVYFVGS
jgi:hypothetical protein